MDTLDQREVKGGKELDNVQNGVTTSTRKSSLRIQNNWGHDIKDLLLEHTSGNHKDVIELKSLPNDSISEKYSIAFETGLFASHDYWWVRFTANGKTWECKTNFYCDLRAADDGTTTIAMLSGQDDKMYVMEGSGTCKVSLNKK